MAHEITLRDLRYLVAVAEHGSITGVGSAVGLSQPAMSAALNQLERIVGASLFVRHRGRGVSLTPEGQMLVAEARDLLARADALESLISDTVSGRSGRLVIGSLVTVAPLVVPAVMRSFAADHPRIELDLWVGSQEDLLEWLRLGSIHVAVTYDIGLGAGVRFDRVADAVPHVMLAADHPLATRRTVELAELAGEPYIVLDLPLSREYFSSLFLAAGVKPNPAMQVPDLTLIRSLVGNSLGYSLVNLVPTSSVAVDGTGLAYIPLRSQATPLALGVATRASADHPDVVGPFAEYLRRIAGGLSARH